MKSQQLVAFDPDMFRGPPPFYFRATAEEVLLLVHSGPRAAVGAYIERVKREKIRDPGEEAANNALVEAAVRFGYGKRFSTGMMVVWYTIN